MLTHVQGHACVTSTLSNEAQTSTLCPVKQSQNSKSQLQQEKGGVWIKTINKIIINNNTSLLNEADVKFGEMGTDRNL